jgi:hypothetical protein
MTSSRAERPRATAARADQLPLRGAVHAVIGLRRGAIPRKSFNSRLFTRRGGADYISRPHSLSGINFGDGPTAIVFAVAVFVLVSYLALARPDIQQPLEAHATRTRSTPSQHDLLHTGEPEFELK